jgi:transcriptional regulator with XRE-family HTH domain
MNLTPIETCAARELGRSLRTWRALRRVKQQALGSLLRVSQATVSRWESGQLVPSPPEQRALRELLSARLDSAADRALANLVTQASHPVHLICDLTHQLLALSPQRERQCRVPASVLVGRSLWRYATDDIVRAEQGLDAAGWFAAHPPALEFDTRASPAQDVLIPASRMRWVRLQLSDGSFARLVETVSLPPPADHLSASNHGARSPSEAS